VRRGILAYCDASADGRAATMALLSTSDGRPLAFLREVVRVMARGFAAHLRAPLPPDDGGRTPVYRVVQGLAGVAMRHATQILRSAALMPRWRQGKIDAVGHSERQHG
jgi:hypothetical protein